MLLKPLMKLKSLRPATHTSLEGNRLGQHWDGGQDEDGEALCWPTSFAKWIGGTPVDAVAAASDTWPRWAQRKLACTHTVIRALTARYSYWLMPAHAGNHWYLATWNCKTGQIIIWDRIWDAQNRAKSYQYSLQHSKFAKLIRRRMHCLVALLDFGAPLPMQEGISYPDCQARQPDGNQCGIYVMLQMQAIARNGMNPQAISLAWVRNVPSLRTQMAIQLTREDMDIQI
jgi:hypothetical protein